MSQKRKNKCLVCVDHDLSSAYAVFTNASPRVIVDCGFIIAEGVKDIEVVKKSLGASLARYSTEHDLLLMSLNYRNSTDIIKQFSITNCTIVVSSMDEQKIMSIIQQIALNLDDIPSKIARQKLQLEINSIDKTNPKNLPILLKTVVETYGYNVGMWGNL